MNGKQSSVLSWWLAIASCLLAAGVAARAEVCYVRNDGDDGNLGTDNTPAEAWKTIGRAAKQARAGDTVVVQAGLYPEDVTIEVSGSPQAWITFRARGKAVVDGGQTRNSCLTVRGRHVRVEGFTFGNNVGYREPCVMIAGTHVVVAGNTICGVTGIGLAVWGARNVVVSNAVYAIGGRGTAVKLTGEAHSLRHNLIHHAAEGIWAEDAAGTDLINNTLYGIGIVAIWIDGTRPAVAAVPQAGTRIVNNIVASCGAGIQATGAATNVVAASNCLFALSAPLPGVSGTESNRFSDPVTGRLLPFAKVSGLASSLFADPKFRDVAHWDFRLRNDSPCVKAGAPGAEFALPDGSRADIGARVASPFPVEPTLDAVCIATNSFTGRRIEWSRGHPHPRLVSAANEFVGQPAVDKMKGDLLALAATNEAAARSGKAYAFGAGPADVATRYDAVAARGLLSESDKARLLRWLGEPAVAAARIQENTYINGGYSSGQCLAPGLVFEAEDLVRRAYTGPTMLLRRFIDADGHFMESTGYSYGTVHQFAPGLDFLPYLNWDHNVSDLKFPAYPNPYRHERYGFVREFVGVTNVVWKSGRLHWASYYKSADDVQQAPDATSFVVGDGPSMGLGNDALTTAPLPRLPTVGHYFLPSVNLISRFDLRSGPLVDAGLMGLRADFPATPEALARLALTGRTATKWITMNLGVPGGWHGHYEKGDIDFDAFGRHWLVSPSSDARASGYQLTNFRYAELSWARNLVCVDGVRQTSGTGQPRFFATAPGLHAGSGSAGFVFDDIDHQRTLVLGNEYLVILDDLIPREPSGTRHVFDWTLNGWGQMRTDLDAEPEIPPFVAYQYEGGLADPMRTGYQSGCVWWRAHYAAPRDFTATWDLTERLPTNSASGLGEWAGKEITRGCRGYVLNAGGSRVGFGQAMPTTHGQYPPDAALSADPRSLRMPKILVRKEGESSRFLALVEPFWNERQIDRVRAVDGTGIDVAFRDGQTDVLLVNRQEPRNLLVRRDRAGRVRQFVYHAGRGLRLGDTELSRTALALKALSVTYLERGIHVYAEAAEPGQVEIACSGAVERATRNGRAIDAQAKNGMLALPLERGANAFVIGAPALVPPVSAIAAAEMAVLDPPSEPVSHPLLYPSHSRLAGRIHGRQGWNRLAFSPDARELLTGCAWGSSAGRYILYDVSGDGEPRQRWERTSDATNRYFTLTWAPAAWSGTNQALLIHSVPAGSQGSNTVAAAVEIWNRDGGCLARTELPATPQASAWNDAVREACMVFGQDVALFRIGTDDKLSEVWRTKLDFQADRLAIAGKAGRVAAFKVDGRDWALLDRDGRLLKRAKAHEYPFLHIMNLTIDAEGKTLFLVRNDNRVLCMNADGTVRWEYDMLTSGTMSMWCGPKGWGWVSRDGRYCMVAGSWGNLCFFDAPTGRKLWEWAGVSGGGTWFPVQVAFTPNFDYVMCGDFHDSFYILTPDGRCVSERPDRASYLNGIALADDGSRCATWTTWLHFNGDYGYERHQVWRNDLAAMRREPVRQEPPVWTQGDYAEEVNPR